MEIAEVDAREFSLVMDQPYHVFAGSPFTELNSAKVERVYYLLFRDSKYRLGITFGRRDNELHSPFSAPFGGFLFLQEDVKIHQIEGAVEALLHWAGDKGVNTIRVTLPPSLYHSSFIAKQMNVLYRYGFGTAELNLNYAFATEKFTTDYSRHIGHNARKNLKKALENDLRLKECRTIEEQQLAYHVIKKNREGKGFPLHMSWEQVVATCAIIKADFFRVETSQAESIASAIVFHVSKGIVQVIYWGDLPAFTHLKTMNFLAYELFRHYVEQGIHVIDIGPSTEKSKPNHGLCEFKESIGCTVGTKFTFSKQLT